MRVQLSLPNRLLPVEELTHVNWLVALENQSKAKLHVQCHVSAVAMFYAPPVLL